MLKTRYPTSYFKKEEFKSQIQEEQQYREQSRKALQDLKRVKRINDNLELPEGFKVEQAIRRSGSSEGNKLSESQPEQRVKLVEQQPDLPGNRVKRADNEPKPGPSNANQGNQQSPAQENLQQISSDIGVKDRGVNTDYLGERVNNDPNSDSFHQSSSDDNRIQDETWTSNSEHEAAELKRFSHGNDYQLKLLMLFASKGKNSKVAFRLATEMAEAEKFDDLVFRYTDSQGSIKYRFLQAKHRQFLEEKNKIKVRDLISNSDNDFSLQKYFVSYLKDKEKKEFKDGELEDFIICTNTDFDFELSTTKKDQIRTKDNKKTWKAYFSEKTDDDTVLNLGGKRYQFNKDSEIRGKIISELKPIFQKSLKKNRLSGDGVNEKIGDFLDKLVFAVEQPSGASLEQKIKDTIGNEFNLINEIIYNDFFKFMYDWMKHRIKDPGEKGWGRAHFLTDKDVTQFLDKARHKIANLGLISSNLLRKKNLKNLDLSSKTILKQLRKLENF
ncbi:hypothetical protein IC220_04270 [Wolbachia endosymbiont of Pentalonia nigronervosa]|uniref:hypothetical protein n=1 Tax=Wolbachia endosymbiont of Pentalonia nigronervosa TaxID=1301914 RepID=UPI00165FB5A7|nr:hypothetical protein [Wolbachia endosymbiont of Pentalonia nigronervosa]MBD0391663.1 hypothetical protein [Wolbachia endosymbiont of Pentalonia nigronervosa]